eukprot:gene19545-26227_t
MAKMMQVVSSIPDPEVQLNHLANASKLHTTFARVSQQPVNVTNYRVPLWPQCQVHVQEHPAALPAIQPAQPAREVIEEVQPTQPTQEKEEQSFEDFVKGHGITIKKDRKNKKRNRFFYTREDDSLCGLHSKVKVIEHLKEKNIDIPKHLD